MKKLTQLKLASAVLFISSGLVHAATPGAYLGLGLGQGTIDPQANGSRYDDNVFAGRGFFGYNFNHHFGLEANYTGFDKLRYGDSFLSLDYTSHALSLVAKGYLTFSENGPFNLYGLLGVAEVSNKLNLVSYNTSLVSLSDNGFVPTLGLGASYDINENLTAGLEVSGFGEKRNDAGLGIPSSGLATLSLAYKF